MDGLIGIVIEMSYMSLALKLHAMQLASYWESMCKHRKDIWI